jgi:hypothetical protein
MVAPPSLLAKTKPKSNKNATATLICLISINTAHKPTPRDKRKMPCRIDDPEIIRTLYQQKTTQALHPKLTSKEVKELIASMTKVMMLAVTLNSYCIGRDYWRDKREYERMRSTGSFNGSSLILVGAAHTLTNIKPTEDKNPKGCRACVVFC